MLTLSRHDRCMPEMLLYLLVRRFSGFHFLFLAANSFLIYSSGCWCQSDSKKIPCPVIIYNVWKIINVLLHFQNTIHPTLFISKIIVWFEYCILQHYLNVICFTTRTTTTVHINNIIMFSIFYSSSAGPPLYSFKWDKTHIGVAAKAHAITSPCTAFSASDILTLGGPLTYVS